MKDTWPVAPDDFFMTHWGVAEFVSQALCFAPNRKASVRWILPQKNAESIKGIGKCWAFMRYAPCTVVQVDVVG
jgi:hypothetical protein